MKKMILAGALLIAGCTAGLPPTGGSAPYVSRYPEPIDVTIPDNAPSITQPPLSDVANASKRLERFAAMKPPSSTTAGE